jgi:glutamine synthetase
MNEQNAAALTGIVTTDLSAITRGRFVATKYLDRHTDTGVGWVPANLSLNAFSALATPNPWGSEGDLRLVPDMTARYRTNMTGATTPFDIVMSDTLNLDGSPWACCTRGILRNALAQLKADRGLTVVAAFEQEFKILRAETSVNHSFSVSALRRMDPFAGRLMAALEEAGVEPEVVIAEYGQDQFEVTCAASESLKAADRAVAIREIVREVCQIQGWRGTFSPKTTPDTVGNGVHIHFSLLDQKGTPVTYDPNQPAGLSREAAAFCAGVLSHLPALSALTAPSIPSFYRLRPHNWSASYTWIAERNREASLRICPTVTIGGRDPASQFNIEYRAADAIANPYLALAAIVRAGHDGIIKNLPAPHLVARDPTEMSAAELAKLGLVRLPESFQVALEVLQSDSAVVSWFDPLLLESFLGVKRSEILLMTGLDPVAICERYRSVY